MAIRIFRRKEKQPAPVLLPAVRAQDAQLPLKTPPDPHCEWPLYDALRYAVPVVDAALRKIVRLSGGFRLTAEDPDAQAILDRFADTVPVNGAGISLQLFADQMLDSLLTYGNAVG
ncbi:MAG: serine/threonine protein phosphatase, partial [Oscillospiraceae bacterium]|nr:serine/threonine protein phosphatase [Oscillospiraceae bacterium]